MERSSRESWHQRVDVVSLEITAGFQSIVLFFGFQILLFEMVFQKGSKNLLEAFQLRIAEDLRVVEADAPCLQHSRETHW